MKYALVNGQRQEAQPGLPGKCPNCDRSMVAKCGEIKIWHWAHLEKRICDHWWENETEWHRTWKEHFPADWQEIPHSSGCGKKHIADVKTDQGWVLEFQHSYLNPVERRARDSFYPKLIWLVDGARRKTDGPQFFNALNGRKPLIARPLVLRVSSEECRLLREWAGSRAPVFFDFGEQQRLWWLLPGTPDGREYVVAFSRAEFIAIHCGGAQKAHDFEKFLNDCGTLISVYLRTQLLSQSALQAQRYPRSQRRF